MAEIKNLSNIPSLPIGRIVDIIAKSYCGLIENGNPVYKIPSIMLWGPPGAGKSQAVRQISKRIQEETNKKTVVTDVRLLLFNPIDLRGIPTANAEKTLAIWLRPQIFQMDDSDDVINILFLDEISAAPQSVQAAAYQITLDRRVGEHELPDNCIVIAAGNRTTDKSVAFKMPKALANRLMHFEVQIECSSWLKWALSNGIHFDVIDYIKNNESALMRFDAPSEELAFATPRTWEMVSDILNYVSEDIDQVRNMIAGLIGVREMVSFTNWIKLHGEMPSIEKIFQGIETRKPKSPEGYYTLITMMKDYATMHKDEMDKIRNSIVYAVKLPTDYSVALIKDYMDIEPDYQKKLLSISEFSRWISKNGSLLNETL